MIDRMVMTDADYSTLEALAIEARRNAYYMRDELQEAEDSIAELVDDTQRERVRADQAEAARSRCLTALEQIRDRLARVTMGPSYAVECWKIAEDALASVSKPRPEELGHV